MSAITKQALRQSVHALRQRQDQPAYINRSYQIQQRLLSCDLFRRAGTLGLYSPIRGEVATDLLCEEALRRGKRVCFPRVAGSGMSFCRIAGPADLQPGAFGVLEPGSACEMLPLAAFDLLVMPGVAFDKDGRRLGYGQGFYDRYLSERPAGLVCVGLSFDFQIVAQIPAEEHDQPLDYIVTDSRVIPCREGVTGST